MANKHGDFVWYELMTSDADAATAFYGPLFGWKVSNPGQDGMDYREIQAADGNHIGGMLGLTKDMTDHGAMPGWIGYISVNDVDTSIASIKADGGKLLMPPRDLEGVGRFAMVTDPQGMAFYVMKSATDDTSKAFADDILRPGHCAWNELITSNQVGAMAFYTSQFGWAKDGEMDMGPMGKYEFLRAGKEGGSLIGAMMTKPPEIPVSGWNYYFRVADIDLAVAHVAASGGHVANGPHEVPDGDWTLTGIDPQGAHFALVGQKI